MHDGRLFLPDAGQPVLNQACEFVLAGELDLRVFLDHADRAVARDLRRFDTRPADLLPPCDVGGTEGVRTQIRKVAALEALFVYT